MSDLIKRQDAIKAIRHTIAHYYPHLKGFNETLPLECEYALCDVQSADRWIPCSERLPETDNANEINEFDVLLAVRPKKHPERTPQVYIGKLCLVEGDDGSGNFWGVKIAPCKWTIWGWSYFQEPEVLAWMPLPKPWKGADDDK